MTPITKIWFAKAKPDFESDSSDFESIWRTVLNFCNEQPGKDSAGHTLWQDNKNSKNLIFISGYPSQESTEAADSLYVKNLAPQLMKFVTSEGFVQIGVDVKTLPLKDDFVAVGLYPGNEEFALSGPELEEAVLQIENLMKEKEGNGGVVTRTDEWSSIMRAKKGLDVDSSEQKTFVMVSGWKGLEECKQGLITTLHEECLPRDLRSYRKIMG